MYFTFEKNLYLEIEMQLTDKCEITFFDIKMYIIESNNIQLYCEINPQIKNLLINQINQKN